MTRFSRLLLGNVIGAGLTFMDFYNEYRQIKPAKLWPEWKKEFIISEERGTKLKLAERLPEGDVRALVFGLPDTSAWLITIWRNEGELLGRIYIDDGNVPDNAVMEAITIFESRYRQRRWRKQEYEIAAGWIREGADPEQVIRAVVIKQVEEEGKTAALSREVLERRARSRIRAALRRRGVV